jgi:NSS family neurotransmitter:Na+ symporter
VGSTAALTNSTLADFTLFGKDHVRSVRLCTSNVLLAVRPVHQLFVGWRWGLPQVRAALSNQGALRNERIIQAFFGTAKIVTPILVFVVLLNGLGIISF